MDIDFKIQKFQTKTETEKKNYEVIKSVLTKIYETETDLIKKKKEAFEEIGKIGGEKKNEENKEKEPLNTIYHDFSEVMEELEKIKEEQVMKVKTKLVPKADACIKDAKIKKQEIGNYKNIKSKAEDQENDLKKMKSKGQDIKNSQISVNLSQNKSVMNEFEEGIDDKIIKYEYDRIKDNKLIMLHFINYEMSYHAKAIEELTKLFKKIKKVDLSKSIKDSMISIGISQRVGDEDDESDNNDDNDGGDDDDDDDEDLKKSKLSKSKKTTGKSNNKNQKNEDNEKSGDSDEIGDKNSD